MRYEVRCLAAALGLLAGVYPLTAAGDPSAARPTPDVESAEAAQVADLGTRAGGTDWPGFLGPSADSKSTERGIVTKWPVAGPKRVWQRRLATGYGMPSISRGRLFMFDRVGNEARLVCLNSETGRELWQFRYPSDYRDAYNYNNGPRCCPVVDGNRVYTYGAEGMLHCLQVADGKPIWKVDTVEKFGVAQNFFGVGSTPVVDGNLLLVQVGGSPAESRGLGPSRLSEVKSNGSALVAFDKLTGKVVYQAGDELASYATPVLATIGQRRWCFLFARGGLLALESSTGKVGFHYPWRARLLESVNASNPVVVGDEVFVSETYGPGSSLLKVRPDGYDIVWRDDEKKRQKAMQTHWNTAIHHEGYLYGCSGRHSSNAELRCIEWKTGKVMWSEPGLARCSLLYVDGHFVCLAEYGTLQLLRANPRKYDRVAETVLDDPDPGPQLRRLKYPAWAAPILSHGLLYVRGDDRLVCLELFPAAP